MQDLILLVTNYYQEFMDLLVYPLGVFGVILGLLIVVSFVAVCVWMIRLIWYAIEGIIGIIFYGY